MDRYSSNVSLGPASGRSISWLYGFLSSREMNDSEQGFERAVIARDHKKMCQAGFIMFVTVLSMAGRGSIRFCALISTMCLYEIGRLVKLVWAKIPATQCRATSSAGREDSGRRLSLQRHGSLTCTFNIELKNISQFLIYCIDFNIRITLSYLWLRTKLKCT